MSGTPIKIVTGGGTIATGTVLAQTGLGMQFFVALGSAVVLTVGGALLLRSARVNKAKLDRAKAQG